MPFLFGGGSDSVLCKSRLVKFKGSIMELHNFILFYFCFHKDFALSKIFFLILPLYKIFCWFYFGKRKCRFYPCRSIISLNVHVIHIMSHSNPL